MEYIAEIFVQQFHVAMDNLQSEQLILLVFYSQAEIQARIPEEALTE